MKRHISPTDVIEAWDMHHHPARVVTHLKRASMHFSIEKKLEDLEEARWYLERHIANIASEAHNVKMQKAASTASCLASMAHRAHMEGAAAKVAYPGKGFWEGTKAVEEEAIDDAFHAGLAQAISYVDPEAYDRVTAQHTQAATYDDEDAFSRLDLESRTVGTVGKVNLAGEG